MSHSFPDSIMMFHILFTVCYMWFHLVFICVLRSCDVSVLLLIIKFVRL